MKALKLLNISLILISLSSIVSAQEILTVEADIDTKYLVTNFSIVVTEQKPNAGTILSIKNESDSFEVTKKLSSSDIITRNDYYEINVKGLLPFDQILDCSYF